MPIPPCPSVPVISYGPIVFIESAGPQSSPYNARGKRCRLRTHDRAPPFSVAGCDLFAPPFSAARAQQPAFEVTSIRSVQIGGSEISVGLRTQGDQVRIGAYTLREYVAIAYR